VRPRGEAEASRHALVMQNLKVVHKKLCVEIAG
jgi:hypothetical protein